MHQDEVKLHPDVLCCFMKNTVTWLTISDIHLGHRQNPTKDIVSNLDVYFSNYQANSKFAKVDIIFIAGDLFDDSLFFHDTDISVIMLWLGRLMKFCLSNKIKLRILEGTPSHDRKQSKVAKSIHDLSYPELDFKYIDCLSIETISNWDKNNSLNVLYVPDEWRKDNAETLDEVRELLKSQSLHNVDVAIMHGVFNFQIPGVGRPSMKHDETAYLELVTGFINIGHHHTFAQYNRILAQGSFDRLSHGQEESKGGVLCEYNFTDISKCRYFFIENKTAKLFKTIVVKTKTMDDTISYLEKKLANIIDNSHVRIKAHKNHHVFSMLDKLKVQYPLIHFTKITIEDEEETQKIDQLIIEVANDYTPITITRDNLNQLLIEEIRNKEYKLSPNQFQYLENVLNELHN